LPSLHAQLQQHQAAGTTPLTNDIVSRIANENAKRERWAVRIILDVHIQNLIFLNAV
jgi:hypothetical protein